MYESRFWKINSAKIRKCCVIDISSRTFSGRYQLMETMFCVFFLFSLLFLPVPSTHCVHLHVAFAELRVVPSNLMGSWGPRAGWPHLTPYEHLPMPVPDMSLDA